jgi:RHS repeat-associated protein
MRNLPTYSNTINPFGDSSLRTFTKKRYRYCGKEKDEESGLYYYGARYYMSWVGRFTSCDPLQGEYPNFSTYCYAYNNPINMNDPTGMEGEKASADNISTDGGGNELSQQEANSGGEIGDTYTDTKGLEFEKTEHGWMSKGTISESEVTGTSNDIGRLSKDVPLGYFLKFTYPNDSVNNDLNENKKNTPMEKMKPIEPKEIPNELPKRNIQKEKNKDSKGYKIEDFKGLRDFAGTTKNITLNVIEFALKLSKITIKSLPIVGFVLDVFINYYDYAAKKISSNKAKLNVMVTAYVLILTTIPTFFVGLMYSLIDKIHPEGFEGAIYDRERIMKKNNELHKEIFRSNGIYHMNKNIY